MFFRATTAREARRLGLSGTAKNLPDGRVEVVVRGAAGKIDELAVWLRSGPPMASVTAVAVVDLADTDGPHDEGFQTD